MGSGGGFWVRGGVLGSSRGGGGGGQGAWKSAGQCWPAMRQGRGARSDGGGQRAVLEESGAGGRWNRSARRGARQGRPAGQSSFSRSDRRRYRETATPFRILCRRFTWRDGARNRPPRRTAEKGRDDQRAPNSGTSSQSRKPQVQCTRIAMISDRRSFGRGAPIAGGDSGGTGEAAGGQSGGGTVSPSRPPCPSCCCPSSRSAVVCPLASRLGPAWLQPITGAIHGGSAAVSALSPSRTSAVGGDGFDRVVLDGTLLYYRRVERGGASSKIWPRQGLVRRGEYAVSTSRNELWGVPGSSRATSS